MKSLGRLVRRGLGINWNETINNAFLRAKEELYWEKALIEIDNHSVGTPIASAHKVPPGGALQDLVRDQEMSKLGEGKDTDLPFTDDPLVAEITRYFSGKLFLSMTQIRDYQLCPRRYHLICLARVPKRRPNFNLGDSMHETLAEFHALKNAHRVHSLDYLLECFDAAFQRYPIGYADENQMNVYHREGVRQLSIYHNRFVKGEAFALAFSVERYFELPCGLDAVVSGKIDRIDRLEDKTYEIIDYKTEPEPKSQREVEEDFQLKLYGWAAEKAFGMRVSRASIIMLSHGVKLTAVRSENDLSELEKWVDEIVARVKGDREFAPRKNIYCKTCDHLEYCPFEQEILEDESIPTHVLS